MLFVVVMPARGATFFFWNVDSAHWFRMKECLVVHGEHCLANSYECNFPRVHHLEETDNFPSNSHQLVDFVAHTLKHKDLAPRHGRKAVWHAIRLEELGLPVEV